MLDYVKSYVALKLDKRGVTALEYAVLAGILAVALVAAFASWGTKIAAKLATALT